MDSDRLTQIFVAASTGQDVETLEGVTDEDRDLYVQMVEEINAAPEGTMVEPALEWPGDQWDDLIAATEEAWGAPRTLAQMQADEVAKSVGEFEVSKSVSEDMFTLGPMYIPDRLDAHAEWTDAAELQKAVWDYVQSGDRRIRLQHDRDEVAGEWVEVMTWPYEVEIPMIRKSVSGADTQEPVMFPPNTVFLGVKWKPWAWELVKGGKIRGYSIGGKAERLFVDLEGTE
jgi:hypothetical protein